MFDRYTFSGKAAFTPAPSTDIQLSYTRSRDQGNDAALTSAIFVGSVFNPFNNTYTKETVDFAVASWRQIFYQEADRSLAIDARLGYFDDVVRGGALFDLTNGAEAFPLLEGNQGGDDFFNFRFSDYELFFEEEVQDAIDAFDGSNAWLDIERGIREPLFLGSGIPDNPTTSGGGPDIFGIGAGDQSGFPMPTAITDEAPCFPRGRVLDPTSCRTTARSAGTCAPTQTRRSRASTGSRPAWTSSSSTSTVSASAPATGSSTRPISWSPDSSASTARTGSIWATSCSTWAPGSTTSTTTPSCPRYPASLAWLLERRRGSPTATSTRRHSGRGSAWRTGDGETQVRFSYGVFNQLPGLDELYLYMTSDITANDLNSNAIIGNPDMDFQETRSFELGLTHLIAEDWVFDLVAYNRDIDKGTAARNVVTPQAGSVRQLFNVNNGNVRGFDLTLTKRFSNYWSADVTYSYLDSKVTDSDQDQFTFNRGFDSTADNPVDAPATPLPADYDITHKLASTFSLRFPNEFSPGTTLGSVLENFGIFATARFNSGLPYTRQPVASGIFIEPRELDAASVGLHDGPAGHEVTSARFGRGAGRDLRVLTS